MAGRTRAGISLIELLVALAVLAGLVLLLARVSELATQSWLSARAKVEGNRGARLLADLIAPELRAAMLPAETVGTPGNPNLQFLINPDLSSVPETYRNPHCLFWQAPLATETSLGEIAEVGYFVKWEETGDSARPSLRRFFVNPTVYESATGMQVRNPDFLIYQNVKWLTPALLERVAPADVASGYAGLVAENVLGLWIRCYGADGREIASALGSAQRATSFDSRIGYQLRRASTSQPGLVETRYLPTRVALSIAEVDAQRAAAAAMAWRKIREMANAPESRDASEFLERLRAAAESDGSMRAILPGVRIYETSVMLENAR